MKVTVFLLAALAPFANARPPKIEDNGVSSSTRGTQLQGPTGFSPIETKKIRQLMKDSAAMAKAARDAVATRPDLVQEYFKAQSKPTMNFAYQIFDRMYEEFRKEGAGKVEITSKDPLTRCDWPGISGYANPEARALVLCDAMIKPHVEDNDDGILDKSVRCGQRSKVTFMLYFMAHIPEIGLSRDGSAHLNSEITEYTDMMKLNALQSIRHAPTYAMFAQAVEFENKHGRGKCSGPKAHQKKIDSAPEFLEPPQMKKSASKSRVSPKGPHIMATIPEEDHLPLKSKVPSKGPEIIVTPP